MPSARSVSRIVSTPAASVSRGAGGVDPHPRGPGRDHDGLEILETLQLMHVSMLGRGAVTGPGNCCAAFSITTHQASYIYKIGAPCRMKRQRGGLGTNRSTR